MSLLYLLIFKIFDEFLISGYFRLGRFINLLCFDILAIELAIIVRCNLWRIKRLQRLDKEK